MKVSSTYNSILCSFKTYLMFSTDIDLSLIYLSSDSFNAAIDDGFEALENDSKTSFVSFYINLSWFIVKSVVIKF